MLKSRFVKSRGILWIEVAEERWLGEATLVLWKKDVRINFGVDLCYLEAASDRGSENGVREKEMFRY